MAASGLASGLAPAGLGGAAAAAGAAGLGGLGLMGAAGMMMAMEECVVPYCVAASGQCCLLALGIRGIVCPLSCSFFENRESKTKT